MRDKFGRFIKGNKERLGCKLTKNQKDKLSLSHKGQIPWIKGKKHSISSVKRWKVTKDRTLQKTQMSVETKVLSLLKSKEWVTSGEFEDAFARGTPGHMSWDQRLSGIRKTMQAQGGDVLSRIHSGHTWEYKLVMPPAPAEFLLRNNQYAFIGTER